MFDVKFYIWNYESEDYDDVSSHLVFPLKVANLLDERLDEFEVQLEKIASGDAFKRGLPCKIVLKTQVRTTTDSDMTRAQKLVSNMEGDAVDVVSHIVATSDGYAGNQELTINCIVASDNVSRTPRLVINNHKIYSHRLYLIEDTKLMEKYMCDSITFTNPLGFKVAKNGSAPLSYNDTFCAVGTLANGMLPVYYERESAYVVPTWDIIEKCFRKIGDNSWQATDFASVDWDYYFFYKNWGFSNQKRILQTTITNPSGVTIATREDWIDTDLGTWNKDATLTLTPNSTGYWKVKYEFLTGAYVPAMEVEALIWCAETKYPMKKWTCKDVCVRIFDLVEPIQRVGIAPRFYLNSSLADYLDTIIAPEFSFTKMTLREQLQMVGKVLQAEPRIIDRAWDAVNKRWRFEVSFDFYGLSTISKLSAFEEVSETASATIDDYATDLDSSVDNLVSQLDWASGVIVEPFNNGALTLHSESMAVRLEDTENSIIRTEFPIYEIPEENAVVCVGYGTRQLDDSIVWTYFRNTSYGDDVDISNFIYEKTDYDNLSNYTSGATGSKAMAIYYTQSQQGFRGLFFKKNSMFQAYQDYAIINILESITGLDINITDYPLLLFRVSYLPIESARLKTSKAISQNGIRCTTPYNQSANIVESKWYGENLRGVIARIGNVEKSKTYKLGWLSHIPKCGFMFDEDYYISSVSSEIRPSHILCSVGLSKDFNRLSEYVGISSNKRMWEVSERQTQRRDSAYKTNAIFSYANNADKTIFSGKSPIEIFFYDASKVVPVALISTYEKGVTGTPPMPIALTSKFIVKPLSVVPVGNSICFTFAMEDNYSAGQSIEYADDVIYNDVKGYWTKYTPYVDFYGRAYYLSIKIVDTKANPTYDVLKYPQLANDTNFYDFVITSINQLTYRKDSREIPQITLEICASADDGNIVFGSGFSSCNGFVGNPKELELIWLSHKVGRLGTTYDTSTIISTSTTAFTIGTAITIDYTNKPASAVAWALRTKQTTTTIQVQDEDGNITTQSILSGGELVIASNKLYNDNNEALNVIYARLVDDTFDKI